MKKENNHEQQEMDSFETFAWLIYREVEKHIRENPQDYQEKSLNKESEVQAA